MKTSISRWKHIKKFLFSYTFLITFLVICSLIIVYCLSLIYSPGVTLASQFTHDFNSYLRNLLLRFLLLMFYTKGLVLIILPISLVYIFLLVKNRRIVQLGFFLLGSIILTTVLFWFTTLRLISPPGWKHYSNSIGGRYRFSYPPDWILKDCGNGVVALTKQSIAQCKFPLEAGRQYLDNLYIQVFPKSTYFIDRDCWNCQTRYVIDSMPENLNRWEEFFWYKNDFSGYRLMRGRMPAFIDKEKYPEEYPSQGFTFKQGTPSGNIRVNKGMYYSPIAGVDAQKLNDDQIKEVLKTFVLY